MATSGTHSETALARGKLGKAACCLIDAEADEEPAKATDATLQSATAAQRLTCAMLGFKRSAALALSDGTSGHTPVELQYCHLPFDLLLPPLPLLLPPPLPDCCFATFCAGKSVR
jgi:hypothetical protein